jgi:hypothetical protein
MCIVPKFSLIDSYCWFHLFSNYLYLVALLNLKVSYAFMFCSLLRTSWKLFVCFSLWYEHTFDFHYFIFMIFCLCSFSCYNMVAKFLLSRLRLSCPCFKFFDPSSQMLTYMIKIVMVHVTTKIISFVITYLLEDEQELSLGMLIRLKRIYNFWCSMLVFTPFALCFVTLYGVFIRFPELTYWQDATVPIPYFLLFLCFRKATQEIFSELDETSSRTPIFPGRRTRTKREPERGQNLPSHQGGATQPLAAPPMCEEPLAAP